MFKIIYLQSYFFKLWEVWFSRPIKSGEENSNADCAGACNEKKWGECYNIEETTELYLPNSGLLRI